jgi:peptide/nickel transport system substrate-binding protein
MQNGTYWSVLLSRRIHRRRALAGTTGFGAAAALLAACGGGSDSGEGGESAKPGGSGLVVAQPDRSKDAKAGGTLNHTQQNAASLDAIGSAATLTRFGIQMLYNRLFRVQPGVNAPSKGEVSGDAAESWEFSPDRLTLTFKIRKNLGSDPRPPLNGRSLDANDVVFSWNKWAEKSSLRSDLVNSVNPNGSVIGATAPDKDTVVFNLAFPSVILVDYLADGFYFWVMPKESDGGFNPDGSAHGAGPYILDEYLSGVSYKMSRNPKYYDAPRPYFDKMNWFIVPEAAAQIAQFEAKNLDIGAYLTGITNDNVVEIKNRHPELLMYQLPIGNIVATSRFGYAAGEPYRDVRVRRGISMAYDREALAEYFTNKSKLQAAGLPVEPKWESHLSAMWDVATNASDAKALGEGGAYFKHDVAESKKLMAAAGQSNLRVEYHMDNFSPANLRTAELLAGQLRDAGFTVDQKVEDYVSWFLPKIYRGKGNWTGMGHGAVGAKFSPETHMYSYFHTAPGTAHYPEGMFDGLVAKVNAMSREFDNAKRTQIVKDFEKQAAVEMPCLPLGSGAATFGLSWPWVAQTAVLRAWPGDQVANRTTTYTNYWFDAEAAKKYGKS